MQQPPPPQNKLPATPEPQNISPEGLDSLISTHHNFRPNRSLMARMVGYYLLLALFTVTVIGLAVYFRAADSLQESVFSRLQAVAVFKEDSLNRWVDEQRRNLVFIAWLPEVQAQAGQLISTPAEDAAHQEAYRVLTSYLRYVVTSVSDAEELFLLDLNGNIILSTNQASEGQSQAEAPYFKQGRTGTTVQPFYTDPASGRPMITVATPIFDAGKRRVGVLAAHLSLVRIDRIILERSGLGESGVTYLVNTNQHLVSAPRYLTTDQTSGEEQAQTVSSPGIQAALQGQSGADLYQDYQGAPVIGVYVWLEEQQVALLAEMSQTEAFAPARGLAWTTFGISLFSVILVAIGVYLLARQIARPILAITHTATRVAGGDLTETAPVMTEDEVGVLARVFNDMTSQLRLLYEGLEKKVAERTADLTHANQRLQEEITERTKAEEALRHQNEYLAALHETSLGIISRLNLQDLLETLVIRAGQLLHTSHGFVYLAEPNGKEIQCKVGVGRFSQTIGFCLSPGEGLAGKVWQSAQPLLVDNYATWSGRSRSMEFNQLGAAVGAPLKSGDQVLGVIGLAYGPEAPAGKTFTENEAALLSRFAQLASIALDNALLYTRAEEARSDAETANRAKSAFLASMSHELRTPLNAIIGFTRIVHRKATDSLPEKQLENLDKVLISAEHLLGLINTILDIAKIEAGRMDVQPNTFEAAVLVELCNMTAQPLVKADVILTKEVQPNLPLVYSDQDKVKQILLNLLSNAAKFTHQGQITVHCYTQSDTPGQLNLAVQDTGIGIPSEAMERIFEEFQQADDSTTRKYGGTGLGLSISRRLARLLGGDLTADSQEGVGSTFTLNIPLHYSGPVSSLPLRSPTSSTPAPREPAAAATAAPPKPPLVLAIDDELDVLYLLDEMLGQAGYQLVGASSPSEGLHKARELQPFAILLDIIMPHKDGWEVLHELKTDPLTSHIPVILLTVVEKKALGYRLGAADYLVKPLNETAMLESLRQLVAPRDSAPAHRLLVVDDDPTVVNMVRQILENANYQIETALDGIAALEAIERNPPDVILLDLMMPRLDGLGVLHQLRQHPRYQNIPVIVLTAKTLDNDELQTLRQSVVTVMQKQGLAEEALLRELHDVLQDKR